MKKANLTFIVLLLSILILSAHDYQTVKSGRISYFENQSNDIKCIRIDSVKNETDSVLFPFSNIQALDYDCYTPHGASWIGCKIVIKDNGYNLFFNKDNDTITIKTDALLYESWTVYEIEDSMTVIAEVLEYDTLSFLGQLDSVKTIGFKVYDKAMAPIGHQLNSMTVALSKEFGMIKTLNFYCFPEYETMNFLNEQLEEYNLIGLSEPKIGIQNLLWFEVNDFQIGDELHTLSHISHWGIDDGYSETSNSIFIFLERSDFSDSILYFIDVKRSTQKLWIDSSAFNYTHDTVRAVIKPDTIFDKLPGETIKTEFESYSYSMNNGSSLIKNKPSEYEMIWPTADSCWTNCCADGCFSSDTYIKGLGGPYYDCEFSPFMASFSNKLVYYKKGEITWGAPLVVTGIEQNEKAVDISVYPNPAKNKINIESLRIDSNLTFKLFDITGRSIIIKEIDANFSVINIENIPRGIYIYTLQDPNNILKSGKLSIE